MVTIPPKFTDQDLNPLFKTREIHVLIPAFLDVFPQLSPTQVGKILSFSEFLNSFKRMKDFSKIPWFSLILS